MVSRNYCRCTTHFYFMGMFNLLLLFCKSSFLYILIGIISPSLSVPNLNYMVLFLTDIFVFCYAVGLISCWELQMFIKPYQTPVLTLLSLHCLGMLHKESFIYCHFLGSICLCFCILLKMIQLVTSWTSPAMYWVSPWQMWVPTVFNVFESFSSGCYLSFECIILLM